MIFEKYANKADETAVKIVGNEVASVMRKKISKTGMRAYDGKCIGVAGAIGEFDEASLRAAAQEALGRGVPYECRPCSDFNEYIGMTGDIIPENELLMEVEDFIAEARSMQPDFVFSNSFKLVKNERHLSNTAGLDLGFRDRHLVVSLLFKERASPNIIDGFVGYVGRGYDRRLLLAHLDSTCRAFKNRVELPQGGGRMPVVFIEGDDAPLSKFITDLHGLRFGTGSSLFSGKIGQKLFSEKFTFYQSLDPVENFVPYFDAEGVVNPEYEYALIENGVLRSPYTDKKTAKDFGLPHTGAAASEYDGVCQPALSASRIACSNRTAKELLCGSPAVLVMIASGGDFTPEGNYATPVQLAMLFDGERMVGRLPELKINSTVFEMFGDAFVGLSSDSYFPLAGDRSLVMDLEVSKM